MEPWQSSLNIAAFTANAACTWGVGLGLIGAGAMQRLGMRTNKEVSADHPTLVTPKGWAFAIWSPIFIGEGVFTVYQASMSSSSSSTLQALSPWWQSTCAAQVLWTLAFGRDNQPASSILISGIAASLLKVYSISAGASDVDYWRVHVPFTVHTSWVCCATLVQWNILAAQHISERWQADLAAGSVLAATVGTGFMSAYFSDPIPAMVGAWALWAIGINTAETKAGKAEKQASAQAKQYAKIAAAGLLIGGGMTAVRNAF